MIVVYIGLGSNLDNPIHQITQAIRTLKSHPDIHIEAVSSFYENPPMGPVDQPDFVNVVVKITTQMAAMELLNFLQSMERTQKRQKKIRWGARTIDADILLYGHHEINQPNLVIPHPGLAQRAFVAWPLFEIAPDLILPNQVPLKNMVQNIDSSLLTKIKYNIREKDEHIITYS